MPTQINSGSTLAVKEYSVALFAQAMRKAWISKTMTGPAPKQGDAINKLKAQTTAGMPVVRVTDLSKTAGDTVSVDCVNIIGGKPIMGDRNAEGRGESLSFSSMDISINMATKVVDAGGKMTQQRTKHGLRQLALANLAGYMQRMETQSCLVHMAGARGTQSDTSWVIPAQSDADFSEIMVNSVKAPTYNRHYYCNSNTGNAVIGAGAWGASGVSDVTHHKLTLAVIDSLRKEIDDMEFKMQPVEISDDPAAQDEPLYLLLVGPRTYSQLLTEAGTTGVRAMQQAAWNRASYGSKHPLFRGEVGLWNGILVKKMDWSIRFTGAEAWKYVAEADRYTANETSGTVNTTVTAGSYYVERNLLLGAQALGHVYGRGQGSDFYYTWLERWYNFERNLEVAAETMGGKAKLRFNVPVSGGQTEPTDHGVLALDNIVSA